MAIFPFKVGDEVLLCAESQFYSGWSGATGVVKECRRNDMGRIRQIIIEWTRVPKRSQSKDTQAFRALTNLPDSYFEGSPPPAWGVEAGTRQLRKADVCHSCVHRLHHLSGGSCEDRKWEHSPAVVKARRVELKKAKE